MRDFPDHEIENVTRGFITLRIGARRMKIYGEGLLPAPGQSDYRIFAKQLRLW
jgi:hypothetical protein